MAILDSNGLPEESPRCHVSSESWLDGMRWKGWTIATIIVILIFPWLCNTSASFLGQEDNQVTFLRIPGKYYLQCQKLTREKYIERFLSVLEHQCSLMGIVMKKEECWVSKDLFEYSRKYYFEGAQVSCTLKRI